MSSPTCRLIREDEFTNEFQRWILESFFVSEPMNKHLGTTIPDDVDLPWLNDVLTRAKNDGISFGLYNDGDALPLAYAINHHDSSQRHLHDSDPLYSSLNQTCVQKYEHINQLISQLHQGVDLFHEYHADRLFHVYFIGVDPKHRQKSFASRLVEASTDLAAKKGFDLIYADVTSNYSLNAFIKQNFRVRKTIDYHSYENAAGERMFLNLPIHQGCSIVMKDLRRE